MPEAPERWREPDGAAPRRPRSENARGHRGRHTTGSQFVNHPLSSGLVGTYSEPIAAKSQARNQERATDLRMARACGPSVPPAHPPSRQNIENNPMQSSNRRPQGRFHDAAKTFLTRRAYRRGARPAVWRTWRIAAPGSQARPATPSASRSASGVAASTTMPHGITCSSVTPCSWSRLGKNQFERPSPIAAMLRMLPIRAWLADRRSN